MTHARRQAVVAFASLVLLALSSGCGSSSKSGSSQPQLKFQQWSIVLAPSNKGAPKRLSVPSGDRITFARDCTATIPQFTAFFTAQNLTGKSVTYRFRFVPTKGKAQSRTNTSTEIRNGRNGLRLQAPTSRGFRGDGLFVVDFQLGGKSLGSGNFRIRTAPNCLKKRAAAGLLSPAPAR